MDETPNERLRIFRIEELDISQKEMARALDMQQGSYSDIERGKVGVNGIIVKLIKTFQINPIWLIEGYGRRVIDDVNLLFRDENPTFELKKAEESDPREKIFELIDQLILESGKREKTNMGSELKTLIGNVLIDNTKRLTEISALKSVIIDLLKKRENLKEILKKL